MTIVIIITIIAFQTTSIFSINDTWPMPTNKLKAKYDSFYCHFLDSLFLSG